MQKDVCYTAGRPPWYNASGQLSEAFIIGISGGSASGKTTVSKSIISKLGVPWVVIISLDSFYKVRKLDNRSYVTCSINFAG